MRKWGILLICFLLFAVNMPVKAIGSQFEITFPEYFEKTSDNTWVSV